MMKLAVPDLISNSYFPAVAAVELGLFAKQGLDVSLEQRLHQRLADEAGAAGDENLHACFAEFTCFLTGELVA